MFALHTWAQRHKQATPAILNKNKQTNKQKYYARRGWKCVYARRGWKCVQVLSKSLRRGRFCATIRATKRLQLKMQHLTPLRAQQALSVTICIIIWLKPIFVSSHCWPLEPLCPFIRSLRLGFSSGFTTPQNPSSTLSPPVIPCTTGPPSSQYEVRRSGVHF